MARKCAKDQPVGFTNRIERVAIVGASGSVGKHITRELLKTGRHTVTALTRSDSMNQLPAGVQKVEVNYDDEATLVAALQGQQFLIITMAVRAPPDTEHKLIQAAAKAGVPYVMPNSYGYDFSDPTFAKESITGEKVLRSRALIEATGVCSWINLVCGYWYEHSFAAGPEWFGFDLKRKKLTLYDDGTTKINISTLEQCGRAVAALLNLKELPEDSSDHSPCVSNWRNKSLRSSSFFVNQRDMFESWKRISGDKDEDWTVAYQPTKERYHQGLERMQKGDMAGFGQAIYARVFYPDGSGDFEHRYGLDNDVLGLPTEDLDKHTRRAKEWFERGYDYFQQR